MLNPATGDLAYANAGHPPPIVVTSAGEAEYLDDTAGTMLGACATASFTTGHRRLPPGASLLCYTDGLIEHRRHDIDEGLTALSETLQRSRSSSAEQTCATVQAALVGAAGRRRHMPANSPAHRAVYASTVTASVHLSVTSPGRLLAAAMPGFPGNLAAA